MPRRTTSFEHEGDAFGGRVRFNLQRTGPQTYRATGILSYGEGAVQIGFEADIKAAVKLNDPTGLITQATGLVPQIVQFMRTVEAVTSGAASRGRR